MKDRNEAALDNIKYVVNKSLSGDYITKDTLEIIRAALTHEDSPVGEVDELEYKIDDILDLASISIESETRYKEQHGYISNQDEIIEKLTELFRTHSQQKDVSVLVEKLKDIENNMWRVSCHSSWEHARISLKDLAHEMKQALKAFGEVV